MSIYTDLKNNPIKGDLSFSSIFQNISYAEKIINLLTSKVNISEEIYGNILLSLSEAINNAIVHGNKFNKDKNVTVNYSISSSELIIEIKDEGEGFDPDEISDPTSDDNIEKLYGRGVFIIISLSDKVEFEYDNGQILRMYYNI